MNKIKFYFKFLIISLIAFLPIAETKVSLIYGTFYNVPWYINFLFSFLGNILIVPAYFYIKPIFMNLNYKKNFLTLKIFNLFIEYKKKLSTKIKFMKRFSIFTLIFIIAIPISGSGTWSGIIIGELLNMTKKEITISIFIGSMLSIIISMLAIYGMFNFRIFKFRSFL